MYLVRPRYEILDDLDGKFILQKIEKIGRVCYKSEERITEDSYKAFVAGIVKRGHLSVIEHFSFSVRFICDRGVSHELVRHRLASFSQESTRYCNYAKKGVVFIIPTWFYSQTSVIPDEITYKTVFSEELLNARSFVHWISALLSSEEAYLGMLESGATPQIARGVLPNSLKTEIVVSANLREWGWIFYKRTAPEAHPQMREIMIPLYEEVKKKIPIIYDNLVSFEEYKKCEEKKE